MSLATVILIAAILMIWICWLWSRRRFYKHYTKLPGPLGLPLIGIGLKVAKRDHFIKALEELFRNTTCITWLGTDCCLYVNDPDTVETIFQSSYCTNKGDIYKFLSAFIGEGLFTSKLPRWNEHRRLLNPSFGRSVTISIFNRECNTLVKKIVNNWDQSLELYEVVKKCTLDVACQTTGKKMNFQEDDSVDIINSYTSVLETIIERFISPWLYSDAVFSFSKGYKVLQTSGVVINEFIENNLKQSLFETDPSKASFPHKDFEANEYEYEKTQKSKSKIFINCMRDYIQKGNLSLDDVIQETHTVVGASFDTISTTVYFVCLSLALNPEYQDKLYNELIELLSSDVDVTAEHLEQMTYAEMVIHEAMRLFAPVPVVMRSASADFHLRDGTLIPQGTQITIDIFHMHRSERVWGPHALSFEPERHFGSASLQHAFAFVPFTKGLRMCIGHRYAMMKMKVILAKIFRNYRVRTDAKFSDLFIKGTISLKLKEYPLCKFKRRT